MSGDLPVAFCAPGRKDAVALALALKGEQVSEVREHRYLDGDQVILVSEAELPLWDDTGTFVIEPVPWPLKSFNCPGCLVQCFEGMAMDPSCHYSFCWITHPPIPPPNLGGLVSGI